MRLLPAAFFVLVLALIACENKALHDSEEFKPREIHENIQFHFDKIKVDGVEYLILEKDNNNPHEGFGFMAFRANKLTEKQDSVLAYVQTINEMQTLLYARLYGVPLEQAQSLNDEILNKYLTLEASELEELEQQKFSSDQPVSSADTTSEENDEE